MHFVIAAHPSEGSKIGPKQKYAYPVTVIAKVPCGLPGDSHTQLHAVNTRASVPLTGESHAQRDDIREDGCSWCYLVSFGPQAEFRVIPVWCLLEVKDGQRLWVEQHGSEKRRRVEYKDAVTGKRKRFRLPLVQRSYEVGCPTAFVEGPDGEVVDTWL